jgi:nitroreductase
LVCGNPGEQKHEGYWVQDCSAATQNILLAAHGLGLGAVWLGVYPVEDRVDEIKRILNLPEHLVPLSLVSIGYPAEEKPPSERYNEEKISHNKM